MQNSPPQTSIFQVNFQQFKKVFLCVRGTQGKTVTLNRTTTNTQTDTTRTQQQQSGHKHANGHTLVSSTYGDGLGSEDVFAETDEDVVDFPDEDSLDLNKHKEERERVVTL